jgi:glycolate oxidase
MIAPADGLADPVVADLLAALPANRVLLDAGLVAPYLRDEAVWAEHGRPQAVVRARTTADVAATVAVCARHWAPVVPRGAGTGMSEEPTPSTGAWSCPRS